MEYWIVVFLTSVLAVYTALSARHQPTEVPWSLILRKPDYFGGRSEVTRCFLWLFVWTAVSILAMLFFTWLLLSMRPLVSSFYSYIDYDGEARAGLATICSLNIFIYLYLTHLVKKAASDILKFTPSDILIQENEPAARPAERIIRGGFFAQLIKLVSVPLARIYVYFCRDTGLIINGCVCHLLDKYLASAIVNCHQFQLRRKDPEALLLNPRLNDLNDKQERAHLILTSLVRQHGYYETKGKIKQYLIKRTRDEPDLREAPRLAPRQTKTIYLLENEKLQAVTIKDYSNNGAGCFLITPRAESYKVGQELVIQLVNQTKISAVVSHNDYQMCQHNLRSGIGIRISHQSDREALLHHVEHAASANLPANR